MYERRPTPESFLEAITREEKQRSKGRLKIFLGMAAGVGKTYAMLEEAQHLTREGVNLAVGIVDTHGREDTESLLEGLKIIPLKKIIYRNNEYEELDIDEILRAKPAIVLVDELAHSNIPGARHAKRWQDVSEILDNGIDVYTTLNVQHIESLNDIIEGITGISVRETVPDLVIERASIIQLVDLSPDELLQRLIDGKVYLGDQSVVAAKNFFQKDRLTALREMVLRYTATRVDHDLHGMRLTEEPGSYWKPRERLLVAISPNPESQKLIRIARRLAFHLDAPWIALHVNNGQYFSEEADQSLAKNLALARELGAEVLTTNDPDIADAIQRIAHQKGVTQIIVGRPPRRTLFGIFQKPTLVDRLAKECQDVDIHFIGQERTVRYKKRRFITFKKHILPYVAVSLIVLLYSGLSWIALPYIGYQLIGAIFLLAILFLSLFFRKGPIFFASILYAFIWEMFFVPQIARVTRVDDIILLLYLLTAIVTGILVDRAREHKEMLAKREESAQALYDIVKQIASAPSKKEILTSVKARLERIFNGSFEIVLRKFDTGLNFDEPSTLVNNDKEKSAAFWVYENGKEAGWSTTTLPSVANLYIPIKGFHKIVGVFVYRPSEKRSLSLEEKNFLYTVIQQLGNYLERTFAEEQTRQMEYLNKAEKIYQTVLKSISQEFQNPLSTIQNAVYQAVQTLKHEPNVDASKQSVEKHIHKIENLSDDLLHILDNVSAMAKLTGSAIPINKGSYDLAVFINTCCKKNKPDMENRKLKVFIEDDLPEISFDYLLIQVLLNNLIQNAISYSPDDSTIEIEAKKLNGFITISVADEGKGIPQDMLNAVFERFYRVPGTANPGIGLGLAISKKIAEIHGGSLKAENLPNKGAKFTLFLPIA